MTCGSYCLSTTLYPSLYDMIMVCETCHLQNADNRNLVDVKPKIPDESAEKSKIWKLTEINEPSQCRSLRLPDSISAMRVRN